MELAGASLTRTSALCPAGTVSTCQNAALVPLLPGLTVGAPETTWSLMPSFGHGAPSVPKRLRALVSFSQKSTEGEPELDSPIEPRTPCWTAISLSAVSVIVGLRWCSTHAQVLRNHACGSRWMVASSAPVFVTV